MKIGIYSRGKNQESGGVKVYIDNLIESIKKNLGKDDEFYEINPKINNKIISDFIVAPYMINKLNLDVVLFPKNVIPFFVKGKKIVTVHDMAYFLPEYKAYKFIDNIYMKMMIKSSCKRADKIIAVSENTRDDLIKLIGTDENKIKIIHEASSNNFRKIVDEKTLVKIRTKFGIFEDFIFYSGSITPRKNILRLIKAYASIYNKMDLDLIITGNNLWNNREEMKLIKEIPTIKVIGYVTEEELIGLYSLAYMYIYPSLYEGFGLPILEAQSCGCPVISSDKSSLKEIGGESVCYVNPYEQEEIKDAIMYLIEKKEEREKLIELGYQNIKRFSWDDTSRKTIQVLRRA
jgi:glycosyltransferase involved in cell wall biosynthesis